MPWPISLLDTPSQSAYNVRATFLISTSRIKISLQSGVATHLLVYLCVIVFLALIQCPAANLLRSLNKTENAQFVLLHV